MITSASFPSSATGYYPAIPLQEGRAVSRLSDYWQLLKPRVMSLVVFTGVVGLILAPGELHPLQAALTIFSIALGAGASGAINMWYDRDIDAVMTRTRTRPIPDGRVHPDEALAFGVICAFASVILLGLAANWLAAGLLAAATVIYSVYYTMWLKRRTPLNIVLGGASGALPPVIAWAAATGGMAWYPIVLFLVIFLWTPPHFWALALYRDEDFRAAGLPMLPVVRGASETRRQILGYSLLLAAASVLPLILLDGAGMLYACVAAALNGRFMLLSWRLCRTRELCYAKQLFGFSIVYLFLLFAALIVDHALYSRIAP